MRFSPDEYSIQLDTKGLYVHYLTESGDYLTAQTCFIPHMPLAVLALLVALVLGAAALAVSCFRWRRA